MSVKGVVERARGRPKHGETAQSVTYLLYKREKLSGLEVSSTHVKGLGVIVHMPIIPLLRRQTGSLGLASGASLSKSTDSRFSERLSKQLR